MKIFEQLKLSIHHSAAVITYIFYLRMRSISFSGEYEFVAALRLLCCSC